MKRKDFSFSAFSWIISANSFFAAQNGITDSVLVAMGGYLFLMVVVLAFLLIGVTWLLKKVRLHMPAEPKISLVGMLMFLLASMGISGAVMLYTDILVNTLTSLSVFLIITGLASIAGLYAAGLRFTPVGVSR